MCWTSGCCSRISSRTPLSCFGAKIIHALVNGGEVELFRVGAVVKADEGYILWNPDAAMRQFERQRNGGHISLATDRRRAWEAGQQLRYREILWNVDFARHANQRGLYVGIYVVARTQKGIGS